MFSKWLLSNVSGRPEPVSEKAEDAADQLNKLEDGCGCAEVWEYLSERRGSEANEN